MRRVAALTLLLSALAAAPAPAAEHFVRVGGMAYTPGTVEIDSGDTVTWRWDGPDTNHSVTSDPGQAESFDSDPGAVPPAIFHPPGYTFSHTFTRSGTFTYFDKVAGIRGRVVVRNRTPTAAFTAVPNPAPAGATVAFDASGSSDPDGGITTYEWDLDGDNVFETNTAGSPTATRSYALAGTYLTRLRVTDTEGATGEAALVLVVTEPPEGGAGQEGPGAVAHRPPSLVAAPVQGLGDLVGRGVSALVTCFAPCAATAELVAGGTVAKRLRSIANPSVLARAALTLPGRGVGELLLRPDPAARRKLARMGKLALTVRADIRGPTRTTTVTQKVSVAEGDRGGIPAILGLSDQIPGTFSDPHFKLLGIRQARYVTPWNGIFSDAKRLDQWMSAARAAGLEPLVAFNHSHGDRCPAQPCRAPSVAEYTAAFRAFRARYPQVRLISPWNEANHQSQPTGPRPDLAARYYNVVRQSCRGCRIVAADVLDSPNLTRWLRKFRRVAKGNPKLWGLHNYSDTNRFRSTGIATMLKAVPGEIWLTETGGVVRFETVDGRLALPFSESRAAKAMSYLFGVVSAHRKRVKRVYVYHWKLNFEGGRFDGGILRPDGTPRPSFEVVRHAAGGRGVPKKESGAGRKRGASGKKRRRT